MALVTAGRTASAPMGRACPTGCDGQHSRDVEGNFFHRGPLAVVATPTESAGRVLTAEEPVVPRLTAHLVVPDGPELGAEPPQITVDAGDLFGPYAELDADQADEFIRSLKDFTARVQQMRDQLAEIKEQQS
ncbi:hypothetical protein ABZ916_39730 [Streptomyces sp. NPDC046853]|uniref:DUF6907 domain-containing protein n=1 Tax=Streptomyces sp. NPDC046853 TaxID=3154920 RepID=UPI0033E8DD1D